MKAAATLTAALRREADRIAKLGYHERAHELRSRAVDVSSANTSLEAARRLQRRAR